MMSLSIISGIAWRTCEGESFGQACDKLRLVPFIYLFVCFLGGWGGGGG